MWALLVFVDVGRASAARLAQLHTHMHMDL